MFSSAVSASQSDFIWCDNVRQRINIFGLRPISNPQQVSMPQLPSRQFISMSQPIQSSFAGYGSVPQIVSQPCFTSPGVAATNCYPTGIVPNQQHCYAQGRSQPMYSPGVAATDCFPAGFVPNQRFVPQAQAFRGQYGVDAFVAPAQSQYVAQNAASTFMPPRGQVQQQRRGVIDAASSCECFDLTGDNEKVRPVAPAAPVAPDIPATQGTALLTPDTSSNEISPASSTPEAPSHLRERVNHLKLSIHEKYYRCAFRLLRSFDYLDRKLQRKYCALFWPSNEKALEDILDMAKLSPEFAVIYTYRTAWHAMEAKPRKDEEPEVLKKKILDQRAELQRTCKLALQDRLAEEGLSQLHQTLTTTKGRKGKAAKATQQEEYEEEKARVEEEKRVRWAKLNPQQGSKELAGQKRKERVDEEPAPAPKKRGRPKKVRAVDGEEVVKEKKKKKRGRPRKVVQVQEPIPDHTDEAEDDGALEAALIAGLSADVVEEDENNGAWEAAILAGFMEDVDDEEAIVESSCQLQGHEQESGVAPAAADDLPAASSEEAPAAESAVEVDSLSQEQGHVKEGCVDPGADDDEDSLFGDDPVAGSAPEVDNPSEEQEHVEESDGDVAMEHGDDNDSLFADDGVADYAAEVDRLSQEEAYEGPIDADDLLAGFYAAASANGGVFELDSFLDGNAAYDIGAKLDSLLDF